MPITIVYMLQLYEYSISLWSQKSTFSNRLKNRKMKNNNLPHILAIIRKWKNIPSGPFSHSGSHIIKISVWYIHCFIATFLANAGLSPPTLDATAMTSFLQVGGAYFGLQFVIHSASIHVRHLSGSPRCLLRNSSNLLVDIPKPIPMLYHLKVRLHTATLSSLRLDKPKKPRSLH